MKQATAHSNGVPALLKKYREQIVPALMKARQYTNVHQVPTLQKIVINMGVKEGASDIKILDQLAHELGQIAGQKPVVTRAKKSISAFHLKQGMPIGLKVTLRRSKMYEFMERLISVSIPRIRDFRGYVPAGFDDQGNYSFGLKEQLIFPEVEFEKIKKTQGMDITFVTSTKDKKESKELLELFGFPFKK